MKEISSRAAEVGEEAFPLLTKKPSAAAARRLHKNVKEFWNRLVQEARHTMLYTHEWPTFVADTLIGLAGSTQPLLRHSAVILALEMGAALAAVAHDKTHDLDICQRQLAAAKAAKVSAHT